MTARSRHRTRLSSLLLLLLVACGGTTGGAMRDDGLGDEIEAPGRGARSYSMRPSEGSEVGTDERAARARVGVERAASASGDTLIGDGRLAILAGLLAERTGEGGTLPPPEVTRFFAWHLGLPESMVHAVLVAVPDPATLEAAVSDAVGSFLRRQDYHAFGVSVVDRGGISRVVVVLTVRGFTLADVPRSFEAPTEVTLEGSLGPGLERPVVEVRRPSGVVDRVSGERGPDFRLVVPLPTEGEHDVRLFATGSAGSTLIARLPLYVGREPPRTLRLGVTESHAGTEDAASVEASLFRMLNDARAAEGLPALEAHEGLVAIARAHSADMATNDFFAHQSPTHGSPVNRVTDAGLSSGLVLENIGRGAGSAAIHAQLMAAPQHRVNVLNREVTHVGIGAVAYEEGGETRFLVTQVFFKITPTIDTLRAPGTLLELVNRARTSRSAGAVERDPNLDAAAQEAAETFLRDETRPQDEIMDEATGRLRRFAIAYRRVGGVLAVVSSLDEAATLEPTFDPGVRYVGIGVAQGTRGGYPPNAIVVVYILGWSR